MEFGPLARCIKILLLALIGNSKTILGAKQIEQKIIHSESRCSTGKINSEYYLLQAHPRYILFRFVEQLRILSDKQLNHCNNEHTHRLMEVPTPNRKRIQLKESAMKKMT